MADAFLVVRTPRTKRRGPTVYQAMVVRGFANRTQAEAFAQACQSEANKQIGNPEGRHALDPTWEPGLFYLYHITPIPFGPITIG